MRNVRYRDLVNVLALGNQCKVRIYGFSRDPIDVTYNGTEYPITEQEYKRLLEKKIFHLKVDHDILEVYLDNTF